MKKKAVILSASLVLLFILIGLYFINNNSDNSNVENTEQGENDNNYVIIDKESNDIKTVSISSENVDKVFRTINNDDGTSSWSIEGFEELEFNQENIESVINTMANLNASDVISDNVEDLTQYGLNPPRTTAKAIYNDNSEIILLVGSMTPDNNYYYAMIEGEDNVYIIDGIQGQRINYSLNELISKRVPTISEKEILYLDVKQKGKDEVEIEYTEDINGNAADLAQYGMQTLKMKKPLEGATVYPNNIQTTVLSNTSALVIKDLIDVFPKDLSVYGLNEPELIINMRDSKNSVEFKIGNDINDNTVYCMVDDRPHIFSMEKIAVTPFTNINILDFIEKFVSLHYRKDIESVDIKSIKGDYAITFGEEPTTEETTQSTAKVDVSDNRESFINGKEIKKEDFSNFFQLLVGITFDSIDYNATANGEAEVNITYTLKDSTKDVIKFYNYNENFYVAWVNGDTSRIVSKQTVRSMLDQASKM